MANVEWAAQQSWGIEITAAHQKIRTKYAYNYVHDATLITDVLAMLAAADEIRDLRKAKAPGELADYVSQGMTRLQQLVNNPPGIQYAADTTDDDTVDEAHAATTTNSEGLLPTSRSALGPSVKPFQTPFRLDRHPVS